MLTVKDLLGEETRALTEDIGLDNRIESGYVCDLLSWAMSHGQADTAWITVQRNLNVVAVATLIDCACVVLAESVMPEDDFLEKAKEENIAVLSTSMTAFQFAGILAVQLGK